MYVGYDASLKSKRAAFEAAMAIMRECCVKARSVRLDQYLRPYFGEFKLLLSCKER
jgi:transposase